MKNYWLDRIEQKGKEKQKTEEDDIEYFRKALVKLHDYSKHTTFQPSTKYKNVITQFPAKKAVKK